MVDSYQNQPSAFGGLLLLNLAYLPKSVLSNAAQLTDKNHWAVLFCLVVIHTAIALEERGGNELIPVHYSNLLVCIDRLVSVAAGRFQMATLLQSLSTLVVDTYSGCVAQEKLQAVVEKLLSSECCSPGASLRPHPGVEVSVPGSAVSPKMFAEHVRKTVETGAKTIPILHR